MRQRKPLRGNGNRSAARKRLCPPGKVTALSRRLVVLVSVGLYLISFGRSHGAVSGLGPSSAGPAPVVFTNQTKPSKPVSRKGEVTGMVQDEKGQGKAGALVRFWRPGVKGPALETRTDAQGVFRLELVDGHWFGAACGAVSGYGPLFWEAAIMDRKVTLFYEVAYRAPAIEAMETDIASSRGILASGDKVTLRGSGFGCSGKVLIEAPNYEQLEVSSFDIQEDEQVRFTVPVLPPALPGTGIHFIYVHGHMRSNVVTYHIPMQALPDLTPAAPVTTSPPPTRKTMPTTAIPPARKTAPKPAEPPFLKTRP